MRDGYEYILKGKVMRKVMISFRYYQKRTLKELQQELCLNDSEIDGQFGVLELIDNHYAILVVESAVTRTKKIIQEKYANSKKTFLKHA
jgi:hypothetical protein